MSALDQNLWSTFLRESSKRSQSQEPTCSVVGDETSGAKQLLVKSLCGVSSEGESAVSNRRDIVSYNYFDIDDKDLESAARVNAWILDNNIFDSAFDILKSSCKSEKVQ